MSLFIEGLWFLREVFDAAGSILAAVLNAPFVFYEAAHNWAIAHQWWPPKDKIQWVTSAAVAVAASYWAALSYRLNRARGTPILVIDHDAGRPMVHNIGEGPALNTFFTDADDEVRRFVGSVPGKSAVPLGIAATFDIHSKYRLYYHEVQRGVFGRRLWTRTILHSTDFGVGGAPAPVITDHTQRLWIAPASIRRRLRLGTPWEAYQRFGRWYLPSNWRRRFLYWWKPRYRGAKRWFDEERQTGLHTRFRAAIDGFPAAQNADVATWVFSIDQLVKHCKKDGEAFRIRQLSCDRFENGYLAHVKVGADAAHEVCKGIIFVSDAALAKLPTDAHQRSTEIFARFAAYYCRWFPRTTFVFTI